MVEAFTRLVKEKPGKTGSKKPILGQMNIVSLMYFELHDLYILSI